MRIEMEYPTHFDNGYNMSIDKWLTDLYVLSIH